MLGCCFWFVFDCFALFSLFFCVLSPVVLSSLEASSLRKLFGVSKLSVDVFGCLKLLSFVLRFFLLFFEPVEGCFKDFL